MQGQPLSTGSVGVWSLKRGACYFISIIFLVRTKPSALSL